MPSKKGRDKRRQHVYRRPRDRPGLMFPGSHLCPECGKWCYRTRADAEDAARQAHPGSVMRFYQCESGGRDWWHCTSVSADRMGELRAVRAVTGDEEPDGNLAEQLSWQQFEEDDGYGDDEVALRVSIYTNWGGSVPRKQKNPPDPGPKPDKAPGCTCGDWKLVNGHWTQVYNGSCPVHGLDSEDG